MGNRPSVAPYNDRSGETVNNPLADDMNEIQTVNGARQGAFTDDSYRKGSFGAMLGTSKQQQQQQQQQGNGTGKQGTRVPIRRVFVQYSKGGYGFQITTSAKTFFRGINHFVSSIDEGGSAEQSGLAVGDRILKVDEVNVLNLEHYQLVEVMMNVAKAGYPLRLVVTDSSEAIVQSLRHGQSLSSLAPPGSNTGVGNRPTSPLAMNADRVSVQSSYANQGASEPPGAAAAVVHQPSTGKILAVRNQSGWTLPAGSVYPGETFVDAAHRRTYAQTGIAVDLVGILRMEQKTDPASRQNTRIRLVFLAQPSDAAMMAGGRDEGKDVRWLSVDELTQMQKLGPGPWSGGRTGLRNGDLLFWAQHVQQKPVLPAASLSLLHNPDDLTDGTGSAPTSLGNNNINNNVTSFSSATGGVDLGGVHLIDTATTSSTDLEPPLGSSNSSSGSGSSGASVTAWANEEGSPTTPLARDDSSFVFEKTPSSLGLISAATSSTDTAAPAATRSTTTVATAATSASSRRLKFSDDASEEIETYSQEEYTRVMDLPDGIDSLRQLFSHNNVAMEKEQEQECAEAVAEVEIHGYYVERKTHDWFGMTLSKMDRKSPVYPPFTYSEAVEIAKISEGQGVAADGRLKEGDRIVKINGQYITCLSHATFLMQALAAEAALDFVVERGQPRPVLPDLDSKTDEELQQMAWGVAGTRLILNPETGWKRHQVLTLLKKRYQAEEEKPKEVAVAAKAAPAVKTLQLDSDKDSEAVPASSSSDAPVLTLADDTTMDDDDIDDASAHNSSSTDTKLVLGVGSTASSSDAPKRTGRLQIKLENNVEVETYSAEEYDRVMDLPEGISNLGTLFRRNNADMEVEQEKEVQAVVEEYRMYGLYVQRKMDTDSFGVEIGKTEEHCAQLTYSQGVVLLGLTAGKAAAQDGRLQVGDRVVKINGQWITCVSHAGYLLTALDKESAIDFVVCRFEPLPPPIELNDKTDKELQDLAWDHAGMRVRIGPGGWKRDQVLGVLSPRFRYGGSGGGGAESGSSSPDRTMVFGAGGDGNGSDDGDEDEDDC